MTRTPGLEPPGLEVETWPPAKRAVYDAAVRLFYEKGFAPTSVQDVVNAAGLTKGALYHYFESKEEILRVINERFLHVLLPALVEIRDERLPAEAAVGKILELMLRTVVECREEIVVFFEEWRHLSKDAFVLTKAKRDVVEEVLTEIITAGQDSGEIRAVGPPRLIGFALFGMCAYAQYWYHPKRGLSPNQLALIFSDLVTGGLVPSDEPTPGREPPGWDPVPGVGRGCARR